MWQPSARPPLTTRPHLPPPALPTRGDDLDGFEELVKRVPGVLPRQHQQPAVALLLQRGHLVAQLLVRQRGALQAAGSREQRQQSGSNFSDEGAPVSAAG